MSSTVSINVYNRLLSEHNDLKKTHENIIRELNERTEILYRYIERFGEKFDTTAKQIVFEKMNKKMTDLENEIKILNAEHKCHKEKQSKLKESNKKLEEEVKQLKVINRTLQEELDEMEALEEESDDECSCFESDCSCYSDEEDDEGEEEEETVEEIVERLIKKLLRKERIFNNMNNEEEEASLIKKYRADIAGLKARLAVYNGTEKTVKEEEKDLYEKEMEVYTSLLESCLKSIEKKREEIKMLEEKKAELDAKGLHQLEMNRQQLENMKETMERCQKNIDSIKGVLQKKKENSSQTVEQLLTSLIEAFNQKVIDKEEEMNAILYGRSLNDCSLDEIQQINDIGSDVVYLKKRIEEYEERIVILTTPSIKNMKIEVMNSQKNDTTQYKTVTGTECTQHIESLYEQIRQLKEERDQLQQACFKKLVYLNPEKNEIEEQKETIEFSQAIEDEQLKTAIEGESEDEDWSNISFTGSENSSNESDDEETSMSIDSSDGQSEEDDLLDMDETQVVPTIQKSGENNKEKVKQEQENKDKKKKDETGILIVIFFYVFIFTLAVLHIIGF